MFVRPAGHVAPTDHLPTPHDRQLYRVTLTGIPLVGPDGVESRALTGEPIYPVEQELARRGEVYEYGAAEAAAPAPSASKL